MKVNMKQGVPSYNGLPYEMQSILFHGVRGDIHTVLTGGRVVARTKQERGFIVMAKMFEGIEDQEMNEIPIRYACLNTQGGYAEGDSIDFLKWKKEKTQCSYDGIPFSEVFKAL